MLTGRPRIADIRARVCERFDVHPRDLAGRHAQVRYARPRQIGMYLARELTGRSFPVIGREFQRHHSTVIQACRRIAALRADSAEVDTAVRELTAALIPSPREGIAQTQGA